MELAQSGFQAPDVIAKELARHLEEQIIFGKLAPRTRLVEEDIVRQYKVSRSPVREALRMLEQEGLATRESRRGFRVSSISVADLDEVYACRLALEGLAAETAATNRTPEAIVTINARLKDMEKAHRQRNMPVFFRQNISLSQAIYAASGSATLKRLLSSVGKQALRYRYIAYARAPEMMQVSVAANRDIAEAIAQGRPRHARVLTEDVIQRSWQVIRGVIAEDEAAPLPLRMRKSRVNSK
jgi:DNA-binding GntR family transcriptional regulator